MYRPSITDLVDAGLAEARPRGSPPKAVWASYDDECDCGGGCGSGEVTAVASNGNGVGGGPFGDPVYVDVYLSAGPHEGRLLSCNTEDDSNCGIYRLRVNLTAMRVIEVERVVARGGAHYGDHWGAVQPALSPSGERLAYIYRNGGTSQVMAIELDGSGGALVDAGTGRGRQPSFPNWYTEDVLLFENGREGARTQYTAELTRDGPLSFGEPVLRLGTDSGVATDTSFADAATRRAGGGSGPFEPRLFPPGDVVTFGVSPTTAEAPRVHTLSAGPFGAFRTEEFELGPAFAGGGEIITECHHPAWNTRGDQVLCTAYRTDLREAEIYSDKQTRMLYSYTRTGTKWAQIGPTFMPLTPDELETEFASLFLKRDCHIYTYKFAEWCGTDNFIVATLYCTRETSEAVVSSRVMLIRRSPVRYLDLTRAVKERFGADGDTYHGVYATCSGVEKSP